MPLGRKISGGGDYGKVFDELDSKVTAVFSNDWAFAALKEGGGVVTWGCDYCGGWRSVRALAKPSRPLEGSEMLRAREVSLFSARRC